MRVDVMQHYGFTQPLSHAGYYETSHHRQLMTDIKSAIFEGHLIALCGVIGSGNDVFAAIAGANGKWDEWSAVQQFSDPGNHGEIP